MFKYNYETYKFNTNNKYNFKKHYNTKKHMKLASNNIKNIPINGNKLLKNACNYCGKHISYKNHIKRHYKTCKEYMKHQIEEDKNIIIGELRNKLKNTQNGKFKDRTKSIFSPQEKHRRR